MPLLPLQADKDVRKKFSADFFYKDAIDSDWQAIQAAEEILRGTANPGIVQLIEFSFGVGYLPVMAEDVDLQIMSDGRTCSKLRYRGLHMILHLKHRTSTDNKVWKVILPLGPQKVFLLTEVQEMQKAETLDVEQPAADDLRTEFAANSDSGRTSFKFHSQQLPNGVQIKDMAMHAVVPASAHVPFCLRAYPTINDPESDEYDDDHVFVLPWQKFTLPKCT